MVVANRIELPNFEDIEEINTCIAALDNCRFQRGVITMISCLEQIVRHMRFVEKYKAKARKLIAVVNGGRTSPQSAADHRRRLRTDAARFYSTLSYNRLYKHANFLRIGDKVGGFASQEALLQAVIDAHVEDMMRQD